MDEIIKVCYDDVDRPTVSGGNCMTRWRSRLLTRIGFRVCVNTDLQRGLITLAAQI